MYLSHVKVLWCVECWVGVVQVGDEREIELVVPSNHVVGGNETPALDLVGLLQHTLGSLTKVGLLKGQRSRLVLSMTTTLYR